ncbi:MAG: lysophospholipid acyltransferase family protein [Candidatus Omnitrophota bacterium]
MFCIFFNLLGFVVFFPVRLFSRKSASLVLHRLACAWARSIFAFSPFWKVKAAGFENVDPKRHYVFVSNHQSLVDILVALAGIPNPFKFIAKKELFSIPFLGWHMALAGYIPLDRSCRESGKKTVLKAQQWLREGVSVLFFPEGTRSEDGAIHEFKPGAFKITQDLGMELVPLVMDGTLEAIPKKSWRIRDAIRFVMNAGQPVRIPKAADSGMLIRSRDAIRAEMTDRLAKLRSERS